MARTPPLTGATLEAFIGEHISYEVESLGAAIAVAKRHPTTQPEFRVAVESVLLHARNLHEFLSKKSSKFKGTVLAVDLTPLWKTRAIFPAGDITDVHTMLAHPSSDRLKLVGRTWDLTAIGTDVADAMHDLTALMPKGAARAKLHQRITYLRTHL